jgi:lipopolysaccharide export system protein LptC
MMINEMIRKTFASMVALPSRYIATLVLLVLGGLYFLLHLSITANTSSSGSTNAAPSINASHIKALYMDREGRPKSALHAERMTHYLDDDITELLNPRLQMFNPQRIPTTTISASSGQIMSDQNTLLLQGETRLMHIDTDDDQELSILTSEVLVAMDQQYIKTEQAATIISDDITIKSIGMHAHLATNKLQLSDHVQTKIRADKNWL